MIEHSVTFSKETCCSCGVIFWFPEEYERQLKRTKQIFYCPNGHSQSYKRSTEDILRDQLNLAKSEIEEKKRTIDKLQGEVFVLKKPKRKRATKK